MLHKRPNLGELHKWVAQIHMAPTPMALIPPCLWSHGMFLRMGWLRKTRAWKTAVSAWYAGATGKVDSYAITTYSEVILKDRGEKQFPSVGRILNNKFGFSHLPGLRDSQKRGSAWVHGQLLVFIPRDLELENIRKLVTKNSGGEVYALSSLTSTGFQGWLPWMPTKEVHCRGDSQ